MNATLEPTKQVKINNTSIIKLAKGQVNLQVLKGAASIAVVWNHIGGMGYLDPLYKMYGFFVPSGQMRPLLFFMLSGYLLGISNKNNFLNWLDIKTFLKKKFFRLYPIYILAVIFTFTITDEKNITISLITYLMFMQNISGELIAENVPLWSMNYEVLFYFIFIAISFFRIRPVSLIIASIFFGAFLIVAHVDAHLIISYCFGLSFWAVGLFCANYKFQELNYSSSYFAALIILIFCYPQLEVGEYFINKMNIKPLVFNPISYRVIISDLQFIPVCLLIVCSFNNKKIPWFTTFVTAIYFPPLVRFAYLVYSHKLQPSVFCAGILLVISVCLILFQFKMKTYYIKKILVFVGNISYAAYLIHVPILCLFLGVIPFSGSIYTAILRLFLYIFSVYFIAYIIENYYHKMVVSILKVK